MPQDTSATSAATSGSQQEGEQQHGELCDHGQNRYTCTECHDRLEKNFDEVLREVMVREGWTEDELSRVTMRKFAKTPVATMIPDVEESEEMQRRLFGKMALDELQARIDATREMKSSSRVPAKI